MISKQWDSENNQQRTFNAQLSTSNIEPNNLKESEMSRKTENARKAQVLEQLMTNWPKIKRLYVLTGVAIGMTAAVVMLGVAAALGMLAGN